MSLILKSVKKEDYKFLYKLLKQRPKDECISHHKLPSYRQHCEFIKSSPYVKNWIIFEGFSKAGNLYETYLGEMGIHLLKKYEHLTKQVISDVLGVAKELNKKIYFNINPKDKRFKSLLRKHCKLIQYTYENIY
jgi:hypothetical protein